MGVIQRSGACSPERCSKRVAESEWKRAALDASCICLKRRPGRRFSVGGGAIAQPRVTPRPRPRPKHHLGRRIQLVQVLSALASFFFRRLRRAIPRADDDGWHSATEGPDHRQCDDDANLQSSPRLPSITVDPRQRNMEPPLSWRTSRLSARRRLTRPTTDDSAAFYLRILRWSPK